MQRCVAVVTAALVAGGVFACGGTDEVVVSVQLSLGPSCGETTPDAIVLEQGGLVGVFLTGETGALIDSACVTASAGVALGNVPALLGNVAFDELPDDELLTLELTIIPGVEGDCAQGVSPTSGYVGESEQFNVASQDFVSVELSCPTGDGM